MSHVLVKWEDNWADEMDVYGFRVFTKDDWNTYHNLVSKRDEITVSIGTNEEIEYESGSDLLSNMTAVELSDSDYAALVNVFGISSYGYVEFGKQSSFNVIR